MKNPWIRSLQLTLGACAVALSGLASAQPAPPPEGAPPPPPAAEKAKPHPPKAAPKRGYDRRDPAQHEAAAVREQSRHGGIQSGSNFENNAMARCDAFKNDGDRRSCMDRVRDGQTSGSVQGGGMLREYTEQVPMPPR